MINKHYLKANFCPKTNKDNIFIFWQTSWVNPFKNISLSIYLYSKSAFFFLQVINFPHSCWFHVKPKYLNVLFTARLGYWRIDWISYWFIDFDFIYDWMNYLSWLYSLSGSHVCAGLFVRLFTVNFKMNLKSQVTQSHYFCYVRVLCNLSKYRKHIWDEV